MKTLTAVLIAGAAIAVVAFASSETAAAPNPNVERTPTPAELRARFNDLAARIAQNPRLLSPQDLETQADIFESGGLVSEAAGLRAHAAELRKTGEI